MGTKISVEKEGAVSLKICGAENKERANGRRVRIAPLSPKKRAANADEKIYV